MLIVKQNWSTDLKNNVKSLLQRIISNKAIKTKQLHPQPPLYEEI